MNTFKIFLTLVFVVAVTCTSCAQNIKTVVLRLNESPLKQKYSKLIVITPENKIEYRDLSAVNDAEDLANNALVLKKEIDKWVSEGFVLITSNATMETGSIYTLQKK